MATSLTSLTAFNRESIRVINLRTLCLGIVLVFPFLADPFLAGSFLAVFALRFPLFDWACSRLVMDRVAGVTCW